MIDNYRDQVSYIRELAKKLTEVAATDENSENRRRWAFHNDLIKRQRPLIWVCPDDDGGWLELLPMEEMLCVDPELKELEYRIRKYLYQADHLKDDFVFENRVYFSYPGTYTGYLYGNVKQETAWGVPIQKPEIGKNAYHLNNFLQTGEDYDLLLNHEVDFIPDETEHFRLRAKYEEVLGNLLEVEFHLPYSVLVQSHLIEYVHLRGLENLMYDVYDEPELLFTVLRHMGESKANLLKRLEERHLLFDNRINIYTGSGGLGHTTKPQKEAKDVTLSDMWGFADAQEFSNVSPKMVEEFAIVNQKIGLNLFGMGCYGCCEPLDGKYEVIFRNITNIRRLSVSPWTNIDKAAEQIGKRAIFSWKPNPVEIYMGFDEDEMLKKLKHVAYKTRDCFVEIILKDIRTCNHTPKYLQKFIDLARLAFEVE